MLDAAHGGVQKRPAGGQAPAPHSHTNVQGPAGKLSCCALVFVAAFASGVRMGRETAAQGRAESCSNSAVSWRMLRCRQLCCHHHHYQLAAYVLCADQLWQHSTHHSQSVRHQPLHGEAADAAVRRGARHMGALRLCSSCRHCLSSCGQPNRAHHHSAAGGSSRVASSNFSYTNSVSTQPVSPAWLLQYQYRQLARCLQDYMTAAVKPD